jgi:hypothetical protein
VDEPQSFGRSSPVYPPALGTSPRLGSCSKRVTNAQTGPQGSQLAATRFAGKRSNGATPGFGRGNQGISGVVETRPVSAAADDLTA